ncbi:hypothetical protein QNI16_37920 [Cytophagaceae bacterium YF14B1]|uniref:Uncharacterized protein n=1 Tax=Xanthocytophaga flava TaxID=3048013 RepID=A0AAE3UE10_9BACT|nr:hypothetical protein [Xanthocytophaga flavus]MDJ1486319.1 hypothetical protein [Xanthocytophaga flavus]
MKKQLPIIVFLLILVNVKDLPQHNTEILQVIRYSKENGHTYLSEKRTYNQKRLLENLVEFNLYNNSVFDSIVFTYDSKNNLLTQIEYVPINQGKRVNTQYEKVNEISYIYNERNALKDIKGNYTTVKLYEPIFSTLLFKDSLKLLEKEIGEIDIIVNNAYKKDSRKLKRDSVAVLIDSYSTNCRTELFSQYGISNQTFLKRMQVSYTESNLLLDDKFVFEDTVIERKYYYTHGLIQKIEVIVTVDKKKIFYKEVFKYNFVSQRK